MRHRKTDAHIATVRVSVPIAAMDAESVRLAAEAIAGIQSHLPPGSTVEVLNSRFGRADVVITPKEVLDLLAPREPDKALIGHLAMTEAMQEIKQQVLQPDDNLEPPESLRRVPRMA